MVIAGFGATVAVIVVGVGLALAGVLPGPSGLAHARAGRACRAMTVERTELLPRDALAASGTGHVGRRTAVVAGAGACATGLRAPRLVGATGHGSAL